MTRALLVIAAFAACAAVGCSEPPPALRNAAPAVTVVAVRPAPDGADLLMDLYVRDVEEDPVDVTFTLIVSGTEADATARVRTAIGTGARSLLASPGEPGAFHRLLLRADDLDAAAPTRLRAVGVDADGNEGAPWTTPEFTVGAGFP